MKSQVVVGTGASASSTAPSPTHMQRPLASQSTNTSRTSPSPSPRRQPLSGQRASDNFDLEPASSKSSCVRLTQSTWYYGQGGVDFPLRHQPDMLAPKTGVVLHPGAVFHVRRQEIDSTGRRFLELADGSGWAFDGIPGFDPHFYPLDEPNLDEEEEEHFDLDAACEKAAIRLSQQPSKSVGGAALLTGLLRTCRSCDTEADGEYRLVIESESIFPQMLDVPDGLDITFTPRAFEGLGSHRVSMTPHQHLLRERIELPQLAEYPLVPGLAPAASPLERKQKLTQIFRDFVSDLHTGMYLTQLTSTHDYAEIHCQLVEDLTSLRLDQCTGRIVEFPLADVSRLYHIAVPANADQIVVAEFVKRKLAFVFKDKLVSQRFQLCMELLVRLAIHASTAAGGDEGWPQTDVADQPSKAVRTETTGPTALPMGSLPRPAPAQDRPQLQRENQRWEEESASEQTERSQRKQQPPLPPPPPPPPPPPGLAEQRQEQQQEQQQPSQANHHELRQPESEPYKSESALIASPLPPAVFSHEETEDEQAWGTPIAVEI